MITDPETEQKLSRFADQVAGLRDEVTARAKEAQSWKEKYEFAVASNKVSFLLGRSDSILLRSKT